MISAISHLKRQIQLAITSPKVEPKSGKSLHTPCQVFRARMIDHQQQYRRLICRTAPVETSPLPTTGRAQSTRQVSGCPQRHPPPRRQWPGRHPREAGREPTRCLGQFCYQPFQPDAAPQESVANPAEIKPILRSMLSPIGVTLARS